MSLSHLQSRKADLAHRKADVLSDLARCRRAAAGSYDAQFAPQKERDLAYVERLHNGGRTIPTIAFPDGSDVNS